MKKFRVIIIAILCFIMAFAFAGCNIDIGEAPKEKEELEGNEGATMQLSLSTLTVTSEFETMVRWANAYMRKNKDVNIKINNDMGSMDILRTWDQNNKLPDMVWTAGDMHGFWSKSGYLQDLNQFLTGEDTDYFADFYSEVMDATRHSEGDKGIYFMPRDYNQLVTYINADKFAQYGIAIPNENWTWADFESICAQIRAKESEQTNYPIELTYKWSPLSVTLLKNFGSEVYDKAGKLTIDNNGTKQCLDYLHDFMHTKKYASVASSGGFITGKSSMLFSVRADLPTILEADYKVVALPFPRNTSADNGNGYVGAGCSGYAITKGVTDPVRKQAAWDFLKFCMSEEGYEAVGGLGTIIPARMSLGNSGSWADFADKNGNKFSTTAFTGGLASPISVNFFDRRPPINQVMIKNNLALFFEEVQFKTYDYQSAVTKFIANVGAL